LKKSSRLGSDEKPGAEGAILVLKLNRVIDGSEFGELEHVLAKDSIDSNLHD